jgi:predicted acetyltransferase
VQDHTGISAASFQFLDPGPMVDGELELVALQQKYVEDVLAAVRHPQTMREAPETGRMTRQSLADFLAVAPNGRHPGNASAGRCPAYHFWMRLNDASPLRIAGGIGLRIGDADTDLRYTGHFGYNVYPPVRGRRLAERSCRLLFPLARRYGLQSVWITCNPDNLASRKTAVHLGATLVEIVPVPVGHELYLRGEREKCRFRIDL